MKTSLLLLSCLAAIVLVIAVPAGFTARDTPTRPETPQDETSVLQGNVESGTPCHLAIDVGPETAFDRGPLESPQDGALAVASFRYWQEAAGPVLYVYDDVQNLVGRVVNPKSVRILDHADVQ